MPSVRWTTGVTILTGSGGLHACVKAVTPVAQTTSTTTATNDVMRVAVSRDVAAVLGVSTVDVPVVQYRATGQTWDEIRSSWGDRDFPGSVSYTHLRAHETPEHLVCRLLLEKKKKKIC